jgi:hypothetical protein
VENAISPVALSEIGSISLSKAFRKKSGTGREDQSFLRGELCDTNIRPTVLRSPLKIDRRFGEIFSPCLLKLLPNVKSERPLPRTEVRGTVTFHKTRLSLSPLMTSYPKLSQLVYKKRTPNQNLQAIACSW